MLKVTKRIYIGHSDKRCFWGKGANTIEYTGKKWNSVLLLSCSGKSHNSIWEQTVRVSAVLYWKGQIRDRKLITTPVTVMDVMPTILELLNDRANVIPTDGKSLLPVLFNESQQSQHEFIFHYVEITKPAAVTSGPYKVVYTDTQGTDCQLTYYLFVTDAPILFRKCHW